MKVSFAVLFASLLQLGLVNSGNIEHVIVLMLENRSLDHMLGFLKELNPDIDGCLPGLEGCSNPLDPTDSHSPTFTVDDSAVYQQTDPSHSISGTTKQIFGTADGTDPSMKGFISSYTGVTGSTEGGKGIMKCFAPSHIPVMANLSMEYGFFDGWFASVPGPTEVNRCYAASATSHGMGTNDAETMIRGQPQKTMFRQLTDMGHKFRVYFQLAPTVLQFKDMRHKDLREKYHRMEDIYEHLKNGDMPAFSWLEPNYFDSLGRPANDQHPNHDVSAGDQLIKDLYDAIRASPLWEKTAFIITYDEHGGFFDHVTPPMNVPNPDGLNSTEPGQEFDFTRLGVRVPTIVVSPWVKKGSVWHAPQPVNGVQQGQYEHSSLAATVVHKLFQPTEGHRKPTYLNKRDKWAASFEHIFETLSEPRKDCPVSAPVIESHRKLYPDTLPPLDGKSPISDWQESIMNMVAGATDDEAFLKSGEHKKWDEATAANYVIQRMNLFMNSKVFEDV